MWAMRSGRADAALRRLLDFRQVGEQPIAFVGEVPDAQQRTDEGLQLEIVDRFGEKVVAAGFDGAFDVALFVQRGDHQDGDLAAIGVALELLADLSREMRKRYG